MPKMTAIEAAVHVLEKEGVSVCFGVPGAAINPFYSALQRNGRIGHILARHVEGASHMAEGYTRAEAGNIGVCVGCSLQPCARRPRRGAQGCGRSCRCAARRSRTG